MDNFGARKFALAIAGVILLMLVIRTVSVAVSEPRNLTHPLYIVLGVVMAYPPGGAPDPVEPMPDWNIAFATADLAAGKKVSQQCSACHDLSAAGRNVVGPGLYGVVGRMRARHPGFQYSTAMSGKGGRWTPDDLFIFLRDPQQFVPWTKMSFAGVKGRRDRINLIAYLRANGAGSGSSTPAD